MLFRPTISPRCAWWSTSTRCCSSCSRSSPISPTRSRIPACGSSSAVESHVVSNSVVVLIAAGAIYTAYVVRKSRFWSEAFRELGRRRPIALAAFAFYVALGLADSVAWIDRGAEGIAAHKPRSLVDRLFPAEFQERSYSAPLAFEEFYGGAGLRFPGQHWLGTDILGRDVLHMALKGARVALLLGGLTSLIAIPLALLFGMSAGYFGGRVHDPGV